MRDAYKKARRNRRKNLCKEYEERLARQTQFRERVYHQHLKDLEKKRGTNREDRVGVAQRIKTIEAALKQKRLLVMPGQKKELEAALLSAQKKG